MAIKLVQSDVPEEIIFETLENVHSKTELLLKLKWVFEQLFRQKLAAPNKILPRLILTAIDKYKLSPVESKILFFIYSFESAISRKCNINISEDTSNFIIKHSKEILNKIVSNYELIPINVFETSTVDDISAILPKISIREHYIKMQLIKSIGYDTEKNSGKIFCRLENGETATVFLYTPWDIFVKDHKLPHGLTIAFYNLRLMEKEGLYIADKNTLMILSPDFVLDVTDIKASIGNINDYLISRLLYNKIPSDKQIIGNAVNQIFDELLSGEYDLNEQNIRKSLSLYNLDLYISGSSIDSIYESVEYHLNNIIDSGLITKIINSGEFFTEPSFLSPEFGLTGRIDVLCNDDKEIIELKTGKPKDYGIWIQDQTQITLYSLMLFEDFNGNPIKITVFYSKDSKTPYRVFPPKYPFSYLDSIKRRNEMILIDRMLAGFNTNEMTKVVVALYEKGCSKLNDSSRIKILDLFKREKGNNHKELIQSYVCEYIAFCERERAFQKMDFSSLWTKSEFQKEEDYKIIGPLSYLDSSMKENNITFVVDNNNSKFREGDICIIYNKDIDISKQQVIRGSIKSISVDKVIIALRNKGIINLLKEDKQWMLESDYIDLSSRKSIWACTDFLDVDKRKQNLILGIEKPEFDEIKLLENNSKVTAVSKQKEAMEYALAAKDYYLIQGPPGTGKTTLLAHLIKEMLKNPGEKILVTAFTNRAVDEIINKLLKETDLKEQLCRLGGEYSSEYSVFSLNKQIKDVPEDSIDEFLKSKRVFLSTIASASYHNIFHVIKFTTSIIDEASQLTEPDTLSVILKTDKFILIGDEKQLPPVISQSNNDSNVSSVMTDNKLLNGIGIERLDCSLFERLIRCNEKNRWEGKILLDRQYRMNQDLLDYPNISFYDSQLYSGEININTRIDTDRNSGIINNIPLEFYNIKGHGERKKNRAEAELLLRLVKEYKKYNDENQINCSIGVIVPFRAQAALILQELLLHNICDVKVDTVERFQGSEKDLIFLSFTVYHHSQVPQIQSIIEFGEKRVDRKLNVALTRAKKKLIMIGNADLLSKDKIFKNLIQFCKEKGRFTNV